MGIQGLLPLLKSIHKPTHLRDFAGQTLGVDAYGWLHRGTVSCAIDLAEGRPTRKHIEFAMHRVRMLTHFGVTPYIVFDGDYLPSKAHTEQERAARRKESKRVGLEMLRMGRPSQAQLELQKAVDVTPLMARELIEELKLLNIQYVVAPYEADSQLAYLEKKGIISGVLSEDSDLLVFGVKCLLTKLDQYGECVMINRADFTACRDISLVDWTDKEFRTMAMLTGCDYLPGINNMGLKTAYRLVRKHKTVEKVIRAVQFEGKMRVPQGYLEAFSNAERTFVHPWAYCPDSGCLKNLVPLPTGVSSDTMPYIGKYVEPELATGVALGDLEPNTKQPIRFARRFHYSASQTKIVQTPTEKQGKPITEFFKAQRVPLAELDPNTMELSPSQQLLSVSQRNRTWAAVPSSAPQASRRTVSAPFQRIAPPKRQRLCSEVNSAFASTQPLKRLSGDLGIAAAMSAPPTKSRFFTPQTKQESPILRKKSNRKSEEFDLWSDDSVAEALAAVNAAPETTPSAGASSLRKRKKISILMDPDAVTNNDSLGDVSQESVFTAATPDSQAPAEHDTPDTSFDSTDSPSLRQPDTFKKDIRGSLSAFHYAQPALPPPSVLRMRSAQPSRIPQRPGRLALKRSPPVLKSDFVPNASPPAAVVENSFPSDVAEPDDSTVNDDVLHPFDKIRAASPKGSEDMLVPNSPDDEPTLELSKFVYAG